MGRLVRTVMDVFVLCRTSTPWSGIRSDTSTQEKYLVLTKREMALTPLRRRDSGQVLFVSLSLFEFVGLSVLIDPVCFVKEEIGFVRKCVCV